jgi:hypothetical protein
MDHMGVCSLIYLWFRNLLIWWNNGVVHQVSQLRNVGNKGAVAYLGAREICSVGGIAAMGVFGCWSGCDGDRLLSWTTGGKRDKRTAASVSVGQSATAKAPRPRAICRFVSTRDREFEATPL